MDRKQILEEIKRFFDIEELVCNHTLDRWRTDTNKCWDFLDTNFLECLLIIRKDILRKPMYCNNHSAGQYQRGLRCNLCPLVKDKTSNYMTMHIYGKAGDFAVVGMTAEDARQKIEQFQHLLPCNIRMEAGVSWLHFDVRPTYGKESEKVIYFSAS